ncbi:MAG: signal peptidase I [Treponema sp.]|uniref:signal peptidase I n=1 Tax=Treponema sp. TaxID=166 RepID=UPI00298EBE11|nr:signal peptidase I [Treponema sp.]MCQ2600014.1 signal peptidase I [Treponema sp.]
MKKSYNSDLYSISYKMKKERRRKILLWIFNILGIVILLNLILSFLIFPVRERSNSMTPDIPQKSMLFVTPIIPEVKRGDVLLVDKDSLLDSLPKKFLNSAIRCFTLQQKGLYSDSDHLSSKMALRRVVGVPGDTIYMKNFIVYVKPEGEKHFLSEFELTEKPYDIEVFNLPADWDESIGLKSEFSPVTLGPNEYYLLADNRFSSMDCRYWGIIKKDDVIAKTLVLYFPFTKIRLF